MAQYGVYRAMVMNTADPMMQSRVQVNIPSLPGGSVWAMPCRDPDSTAVPQIGTTVWIMFEGGDVSRPVWVGSMN